MFECLRLSSLFLPILNPTQTGLISCRTRVQGHRLRNLAPTTNKKSLGSCWCWSSQDIFSSALRLKTWPTRWPDYLSHSTLVSMLSAVTLRGSSWPRWCHAPRHAPGNWHSSEPSDVSPGRESSRVASPSTASLSRAVILLSDHRPRPFISRQSVLHVVMSSDKSRSFRSRGLVVTVTTPVWHSADSGSDGRSPCLRLRVSDSGHLRLGSDHGVLADQIIMNIMPTIITAPPHLMHFYRN